MDRLKLSLGAFNSALYWVGFAMVSILLLGPILFLAKVNFEQASRVKSSELKGASEALTTLGNTAIYLQEISNRATIEDSLTTETSKLLRAEYHKLVEQIDILNTSQNFKKLRTIPEIRTALNQSLGAIDKIRFIPLSTVESIFSNLEQIAQSTQIVSSETHHMALASLTFTENSLETQTSSVAKTLTNLARLLSVTAGLITAFAILILYKNKEISRGRKATSEIRAQLRSTTAASLDAILVVNEHGIVFDFNKSAEQLFGHTKEQAVGRNMIELFFPEDRVEPSMRSIRRFLATGDDHQLGRGRVQLVARHKNGKTFPVELSIGTIRSQDGQLFIAYLRDISTQLAAENELMRARDKALEGENAKSRFLAVMSHEMRTPLNGLLGTLDLLSRTSLTTKQIQYLTIATKSGNLLLDHVNDVLDISKIEAGHAKAGNRPFNPFDIMVEVRDGQRSLASSRGNDLSIGTSKFELGTVVGDPGAIRQILLNLVSNANKFTTRGNISIEAEDLKNGVGDIEFRVADTGIGVAEESVKDIFTDFVTLDPNFDREAEGTGLGLPIAKRLVKAMGGEIGVESEEGEGSLFWFRVPFARHMQEFEHEKNHPSQPSEKAESSKNFRPLEILLVEDNQINRFVAREMLEADGHSVSEALDGEEGAQLAIQNSFDVILMDISMPNLDGVTATERIRESKSPYSGVAIIALTAHALPDDIKRFQAAGMDYCLAKPVVRDELRDLLTKSVEFEIENSKRTHTENDIHEDEVELVDKDILLQLLEILGPTRVANLFTRFITEAEVTIAKLAQLDDPHHIKDSIPQVHRLAGSASTFGAQHLQATLYRLEKMGKAGQNDGFLNELPSLPAIFNASKIALESEISC